MSPTPHHPRPTPTEASRPTPPPVRVAPKTLARARRLLSRLAAKGPRLNQRTGFAEMPGELSIQHLDLARRLGLRSRKSGQRIVAALAESGDITAFPVRLGKGRGGFVVITLKTLQGAYRRDILLGVETQGEGASRGAAAVPSCPKMSQQSPKNRIVHDSAVDSLVDRKEAGAPTKSRRSPGDSVPSMNPVGSPEYRAFMECYPNVGDERYLRIAWQNHMTQAAAVGLPDAVRRHADVWDGWNRGPEYVPTAGRWIAGEMWRLNEPALDTVNVLRDEFADRWEDLYGETYLLDPRQDSLLRGILRDILLDPITTDGVRWRYLTVDEVRGAMDEFFADGEQAFYDVKVDAERRHAIETFRGSLSLFLNRPKFRTAAA